MSRNLKTLGLALVAVLALAAASAAAASAETFAFHSEVEDTTLTGSASGSHKLTVDAGTATCKGVDLTGTMSAQETSEVRVAPVYTECTALGGTTDVTMNGCQYALTPVTKEGSNYITQMALSCETGKSVEIKMTLAGVTKCTIHIPGQVLGNVTATEVAAGDVSVAAKIEGVDYSQTAGSGAGACAKAENTTNGIYEGTVVIAGSVGAAQVNIAMQAIKAVLVVESPIKFGGLNTEQTIKIENKSGAALNNGLDYLLVNPDGNDFDLTADTCSKGIPKDQTCQAKLKCIKASGGKIARFLVETKAPDPHGIGAAKLEGC